MKTWPRRARCIHDLFLCGCFLALFIPARAEEERPRENKNPYRSLNLPRDRAERLQALQMRVDRENRQLKDRLDDYRDDLDELYGKYRFDESRCQRLRQQIEETQHRLLELHHQFQVDLRAILTEPEFMRLQQALREARKQRKDD
jgi:Spy/CpxP family protein refolding chaperone